MNNTDSPTLASSFEDDIRLTLEWKIKTPHESFLWIRIFDFEWQYYMLEFENIESKLTLIKNLKVQILKEFENKGKYYIVVYDEGWLESIKWIIQSVTSKVNATIN